MPTFVHGRKTAVFFGAHDLSPFFNSSDVAISAETHETTAYGSDTKTYIPGLVDATLSAEGLFDGSAEAVDEILENAVTTDAEVPVSLCHTGAATLGARVKLARVNQTNYGINSSVGDLVTVSLEAQATGGAHGGVVLAEKAARTATGDGTTLDQTASSTGGYAANLHVFDASGATPTLDVTIQHSADGDTWADLATFTQATEATAEQKTGTGTVQRYVRASWTLDGTSPSFSFALTFARL